MMHRQNQRIEDYTNGISKIRKRTSTSSSASSTLIQNYRFKKAIMVGRRGGPTTPSPNWTINPRSPSINSRISESTQQPGPVSARKLANALWELNQVPSPKFSESLPPRSRRSKKISKPHSHRLSDPSHSPESERSDRLRSSCHRRIVPMVNQKNQYKEHNYRALDLISSASLMEVDARSQRQTSTSSTIATKNRLKELKDSLSSFKELLKLLSRIWGRDDQQARAITIFSALRVELDQARSHINHLIQEQRIDQSEINSLKKRFMEEKSSWKTKINDKMQSIFEELESEKKLRRRAERLNTKLGFELANTKATLSRAVKELESERRSRELIENICNEVVRGVGEDKAEVEEMKKESVKVREELEKEREMLHIADELREERVHMKLLEAKAQFEEKNAAVDQLRNELETFLDNSRKNKDNEVAVVVEEEDDDESSNESELHSIELNTENKKDYNIEDAERYVSVKKLRENMLSASRIALPRGLSSPTRQWNRNRGVDNSDGKVGEKSVVAKMVKMIKEGGSKARSAAKNAGYVHS